jgi:hypothetical protein
MEETVEKKKRIKYVFRNIDEIVHLWAHQSQEEARCRNAYFEKETIYSYGRHFPIARIYTKNKGKKNEKKVVFFTLDTYSSTTAQHISSTRSACSHMEKIYMKHVITGYGDPAEDIYAHEQNFKYWHRTIEDYLDKFSRARDAKESYLGYARRTAEEAKLYITFLGIKPDKRLKALFKLLNDPKWENEITEYKERTAARLSDPLLQEKREKARLAREKALQKQFTEQIQKWRNFEAYNPYRLPGQHRHYHTPSLPDLLRYKESEQRVETSQGVQVPIEIAHRFYRQIKIVLSRGGCLSEDACAEKILNYSVQEITAEHIRVGCHRIPMTEVEAIANQLKWNGDGRDTMESGND